MVTQSEAELAQLDAITKLYEQGLCLQALAAAERVAPVRAWTSIGGRIMVSRLAANLGAPRLAASSQLQAYRSDRGNPEAIYYYARLVMERKGPLKAWEFLKQQADFAPDSREREAEWLALQAGVLGQFRDFDSADALLDRAEAIDPTNAWLQVERCSLLEHEDRYKEALAAARRSLELRPWFRPGVQAVGHLLQLLDREDEALAFLREAEPRLESALVASHQLSLEKELRLYEEAQQTLDRLRELSPLAEEATLDWLACTTTEIAYQLGDYERAFEAAREVKHPFFSAAMRNAQEAPPDARRVLHPVDFVRQHHVTCGPATLTTLTRFWGKPADHLAVAEEICYDGTSDHAERNWAETHGWAVREFRIDWDSARTLLDHGAPFSLATVEPNSAHLQAIIGYDERRRTFVVRDPYISSTGEFLADETLERYASTGPRGMVLIPREQSELLDGVALPEAEQYDLVYRLQRALETHDRSTAEAACQELEGLAPGKRLTLHARRLIGRYDGDLVTALTAVESLLELYPRDANLQMSRLSLLRDLSRPEERLAALEKLCRRKAEDGASPPALFFHALGRELLGDARESTRCERLLRQAIRVSPKYAACYHALATSYWDRGQRRTSLELYRFAACLDDRDEAFARSYFTAARHFGETEQALSFLRGRFERFGTRSAQPAITLFRALHELDRTQEGLETLERATTLRPEDGYLLLFASDAYGRLARFGSAAERMEMARGRCPDKAWNRQAAANALYAGDPTRALELWRRVLATDPLAMDAHAAVARILAGGGDTNEIHRHFQEYTQRFPHSYALHRLWAERCRDDEDLPRIEAVIRRLLEISPRDAWARRELASKLGNQGRFEEAFQQAELAREVAPADPAFFNVYANLCRQAGRWEEARQTFRAGVQAAIDNAFALQALLHLAETAAQRREVMLFAAAELERQTTFGEGLAAFRAMAGGVLEPEEVLATVRGAIRARPDLWHAWVAVVRQLAQMDRLDEALELAKETAHRFPLAPGSWVELATVRRIRFERVAEREALEKALEIAPGFGSAVIALARWLQREGERPEEVRLLEGAVPKDPLNVQLAGTLADALWRADRRDEAVDRLKLALRIDPDHEDTWERLSRWSRELGRPEEPERLARDLTSRRPLEPGTWLILARTLSGPEALEERIAALDRAIALSPRVIEAYDRKMELLSESGRHDEARSVVFGFPGADAGSEAIPVELRARLAWIDGEEGKLDAAMEAMKAVLQEAPRHQWGWWRLAKWADQARKDPEYLEASAQLARLSPQAATAHGWHGEALLRNGDRSGAKAAWRRALELTPNYAFAGFNLFDTQFEDGELDAAAETLKILLQEPHRGFSYERGTRLASRQRDAAGVREHFRRLCLTTKASSDCLSRTASQLREDGWGMILSEVYDQVLMEPGVCPAVGSLWMARQIKLGDWRCSGKLDVLMDRGEVGVAALSSFLIEAGKARRSSDVRGRVRQHRDRLRQGTWSWGVAGRVLYQIGAHQECAEWLSDWSNRPNAEPWMLLNLVVALRHLRREEEARQVSRAAVKLPKDTATLGHRIWLAFDAQMGGGEWDEEAFQLDTSEAAPFYNCMHALLQALMLRRDLPASFGKIRSRVNAARNANPGWWRDPLLRRALDDAVSRIAAESGTLGAHLWSLTRFWRVDWP